ncbi:MAG TPA: tRNA (adenosine(37)-N6)-dimethylallyltransferase MiaA [Candidatus Portnoybacteria bacterium]|uniref:tRNA dimethylallyltransferase n=1 Tax=Candidatus Portnoybacteria bacterium CG02_land_8_20_14_3_00_45_8 TaxID=1974807 RepID=A0A2M7D740_9BACT|nr:MAG: tRNA (adenosine(37)-N6)-dimethylallyltransferase MiaA [Candidatus Portnoybacteria bacterium CG02_land_8_20_14_3_00_45_8]HCX27591.1 tRNA (adenosine(37)-N6)-dimethylallyltransferase MiaA [Candidatus Portnoybacteria bacterium]
MKNKSEKIIVVLGPTSSGKSDLAVALALRLSSGQAQKKFGIRGAEIISADSRQVYQGMNLGSGKITKKEMRGVPHYLLDVASPKRRFTAAQYKKLAQATIKKIHRQNKLPIICGGTGFYIQALTDNLALPKVKPNLKLRAQLEKLSTPKLYQQLKKLDPRRAKNIDCFNRRRLIRALEIIKTTGQPIPRLKNAPAKNILFLGIEIAPEILARRIKIRLEKRLKQGMLAEVKKLHAQGLSWKRLDGFGLEYRWLARYLQKKTLRQAQDKLSYQEMTARLQKDTEHYAKRQMTWFNRNGQIRWIKNERQAENIVKKFLK